MQALLLYAPGKAPRSGWGVQGVSPWERLHLELYQSSTKALHKPLYEVVTDYHVKDTTVSPTVDRNGYSRP
jgi:hypothetical protein